MKVEVVSNNSWLYPDRTVSTDKAQEITLHSAKNATAAVQLLFNDLPVGAELTFSSSIFENELTVSREIPVLVAKNSGNGSDFFEEDWEKAQKYATRKAPFEVFDALEQLNLSAKINTSTEAYLLTFEIPKTAETGAFTGKIQIKTDKAQLEIPLEIKIYQAEIPEQETLQLSNWYWVAEMAEQYRVEAWSDAHFAVMEQYGKLMRRTRQTHFWIPKEALIVRASANGWSFDFSRIKRLIELMLGLGFSVIEGPLIAHRGNFGDDFFLLTVGDKDIRALSPEGRSYLEQFLTAWKRFLEENNWLTLLQQHVADEPTDACAAEFQALVKIIRQHLPEVKLLEAVDTHDFGENGKFAPDILIPTNMTYQESLAVFEDLRDKGHELWFYTCCYPNGHFLNRFLDMPLIRTRLLHWANRKYHLTGYLHWGLNAGLAVNPYQQENPYFPCGDMTMTYPSANGPRASMRLEMMRQGVQDFELLNQLMDEKAQPIISEVLSDFSHFDENPEHLENQRKKILLALEKGCASD